MIENKTEKASDKRGTAQNDRPTVGFLTHGIWDPFGVLLWHGAMDAAEEEGVNLICFPGRNLNATLQAQANLIYDLVSDQHIDGLIISASALGSFVGLQGLRAFCNRYHPLPMVNLSAVLEGIPAVSVDNYQGVCDVVIHLLDVHGCRRIALIPGPPGNAESRERYQAYVDILNAYGIPFDPDLVAPPGDWDPPSGRHAVHVLLDERQVNFDAVVAANDGMAIGAMEVLQERGMVVPDDIVVTGFNDSEEAWFIAPPLTTVRQPTYDQLKRAMEIVLAQLRGEQVPDRVALPMKVMVRQSCGCLDPKVMQTAAVAVPAAGETFETTVAARRKEIIQEMARAAVDRSGHLSAGWAAQLLDAFVAEMNRSSTSTFLLTLNKMLRQEMATGSNVADWHNVLSVLRRYALPCLDGDQVLWAEDLWRKANIMIGETVKWVEMRQAWQKTQQARLLGDVEGALTTTFDVARLMDVLVERLPLLGIPSCYLSMYEDPSRPADWARLILAYSEQERVALQAGGLRFPSRHLLPESFWPRGRPYHLVVEPLYFQDNHLGFVVFEVGPRDGDVYEVLRRELSSALQGALLVQRVQEHSAELTRQQYILDTFMENIPDLIYFKDLNSRITRANKAYAIRRGLSNPAQLIGKSDFDFFPEEQARVKYEEEQEIARTGQPKLNYEDPDGRGNWGLTTKMPLRDEHGEIIGTFGISRDITELKRVEAELVRQERLSALGQLTATVAHEIRNPLGTVRNCVFTIGDAIEQNDLGRVERALQLADRNIMRCATIITELLDYTRDRVLQPSLTHVDAWLEKVLDEALDQQTIPENITCIRDLNADVEISLDSEHLRRAIINVVSNAIDAMQEVGPAEEGHRLTVSTHVCSERLEIQIKDTGCGIPDAVLDKIFEPLFSTKNFGVGLGLSVVKSIMEHHGGGVEISSELNAGTTVVLWLPMPDLSGD